MTDEPAAIDRGPDPAVIGVTAPPGGDRDRRRIVVVGPCASGKTTLVAGLRRLGYEARVCGQEHSEIPTLWRRTAPDLVVVLAVDLPTLRRRRGADWPEWLYRIQHHRLRAATAAADLVIDTSTLDAAAVVCHVVSKLRGSSPDRDCGPTVRSAATE